MANTVSYFVVFEAFRARVTFVGAIETVRSHLGVERQEADCCFLSRRSNSSKPASRWKEHSRVCLFGDDDGAPRAFRMSKGDRLLTHVRKIHLEKVTTKNGLLLRVQFRITLNI